MLAGKPSNSPPPQYTPSFKACGVVAEQGKLIEVRAPSVDGMAQWDRIYLTEEAARRLLNWLPNALAFAEGGAT